MLRKLVISVGDVAGVGPEVAVKAALDKGVKSLCVPVLATAAIVLQRVSSELALDFEYQHIRDFDFMAWQESVGLVYYDDNEGALEIEGDFAKSALSADCGRLAYNGASYAIKSVIDDVYAAVVTAPLNKEAVNLAGIDFLGHTELVAEMSGTQDFCMMQSSGNLRMVFVTCHQALKDIFSSLSPERFERTTQLLYEACLAEGIAQPRLATCGLNPHAGESGLMGEEEREWIIPTLEKMRERGIDIDGPFPPDTIFLPKNRELYDGFVCFYHDQGHIPFKLLAFETGVNSTLGLPIIRTSVDHGTAFDIAWRGQASEQSLVAAIGKAVALLEYRR